MRKVTKSIKERRKRKYIKEKYKNRFKVEIVLQNFRTKRGNINK